MEDLKKQPLKHQGTPEDVSHCVLFLASPKSAFITGACLQTDETFAMIIDYCHAFALPFSASD
ncbi:hypothetical protein B4U80_14363 [Leptotrombidium deliense]|uniref:Uncharacterized protein n=1 Tax=Leptotrombidium deliense TaxID=299467 RepID=A0A443RXS0_9ACAR|nr:hypothetical protein B4U80_14363 [Leptotrombidium deliense]